MKTEQREEDVLVLIPVADFVLFVQNYKMVSVECSSFPSILFSQCQNLEKNDMVLGHESSKKCLFFFSIFCKVYHVSVKVV